MPLVLPSVLPWCCRRYYRIIGLSLGIVASGTDCAGVAVGIADSVSVGKSFDVAVGIAVVSSSSGVAVRRVAVGISLGIEYGR